MHITYLCGTGWLAGLIFPGKKIATMPPFCHGNDSIPFRTTGWNRISAPVVQGKSGTLRARTTMNTPLRALLNIFRPVSTRNYYHRIYSRI
jgi:hypothetical protein